MQGKSVQATGGPAPVIVREVVSGEVEDSGASRVRFLAGVGEVVVVQVGEDVHVRPEELRGSVRDPRRRDDRLSGAARRPRPGS